MRQCRTDSVGRDQLEVWEEVLRQEMFSGKDPIVIIFTREERSDEYVHLHLHRQVVRAEVGSRESGSNPRPLASTVAARLATRGFSKSDRNPNFLQENLSPEPESLARLTLSLFRTAYDVPAKFSLKIEIGLDPMGRAEGAPCSAGGFKPAIEIRTVAERRPPANRSDSPSRACAGPGGRLAEWIHKSAPLRFCHRLCCYDPAERAGDFDRIECPHEATRLPSHNGIADCGLIGQALGKSH